MAKTKFDIPTQIPEGATRPLYAGAGVTDRVVEVVRDYVADMQKRVTELQKTVADFQVETLTKNLGKDAQARRARVEKRVAELQAEALALPTKLQKLVDEQVATAGDTYEDLVKRGESLVARIRGQESTQATVSSAKTATAKAKTTVTQASKTASGAKKSATKTAAKARKSPARSSAKATRTAAEKTATSAVHAVADGVAKVGD